MRIMNFIIISLFIFILSLLGILINRSNIILLLVCFELMLLSISLNFILTSYINNHIIGQLMMIFILTLAAVESAIGLSIMISFYKVKGTISIRSLNLLKG